MPKQKGYTFYGVLNYTDKRPDIMKDIENGEGEAHFTMHDHANQREFTVTLTVSFHGGITLTLEDGSYERTELFRGNAFDLLKERLPKDL